MNPKVMDFCPEYDSDDWREYEWTTGAGEEIPICDMTDQHLVNTIRYLIRNNRRYVDVVPYPMLQGEMAQYHAEGEWLAAMEDDEHVNDGWIELLLKEAALRELRETDELEEQWREGVLG